MKLFNGYPITLIEFDLVKVITVLPQIMTQVFIFFQQPFTLVTEQNRRIYETCVC